MGENIDTGYQNWTPLMAACERGYFSIALLLLDHGADTTAVNSKGRGAVSFAAAPSKDNDTQTQRVSQLEIIRLLAERGAPLKTKDKRNRTPQDQARAESQLLPPYYRRTEAANLLKELESA